MQPRGAARHRCRRTPPVAKECGLHPFSSQKNNAPLVTMVVMLIIFPLLDAFGAAEGYYISPPPSPPPPSPPQAPPASTPLTGKCARSYGYYSSPTCHFFRATSGTLLRSRSSREKSCQCTTLDLRNTYLTHVPAGVFDGRRTVHSHPKLSLNSSV